MEIFNNSTANPQPEHETGGEHSGEELPKESLMVMLLFACLLLGGFLRTMNKKYGIPYTPTLFFIGVLCGKFYYIFGGWLSESFEMLSKINPHGLLFIFLPILVFDAGFNMEWHIFKKELGQISVLAFPVVLINAFLMTMSVKLIAGYDDDHYTWNGAFLFGSIISCTDPVAVVALLKELGASKRFATIIEGESLLNDAVGMILFNIGSAIYKGGSASIFNIAWLFLTLAGGGVVLGILVGMVASFIILKAFNDELLVVNTTFVFGYVGYFIAESILESMGIAVSGIMTLCAYGVFMAAQGKFSINPESDHAVHTFWFLSP